MAFPVPGEPAPKSAPKKKPFRADSWGGSFVVIGVLLGVLWLVQAINVADGGRLVRFGLRPRELDGLEGIVTSPFLHANSGHLMANSLPFLALGWLVLTAGFRNWLVATLIIVGVDGVFTWLTAPSGLVVGASGVVFGWLGYLIARAYFARKFAWIIIAVAAAATFSSLFSGLLPGTSHVSWQAHVGGFAGGVIAGWILHPRKKKPRAADVSGPGRVVAP
jgi:membrane associated rhomboid family serine protease